LHLVGSSILFYVIDDARTNKNQVYIKLYSSSCLEKEQLLAVVESKRGNKPTVPTVPKKDIIRFVRIMSAFSTNSLLCTLLLRDEGNRERKLP